LGGAHGVLPLVVPAISWLETALNNLALAATNHTAVLQQPTAVNLALTTTITAHTGTNKALVDLAAKSRVAAIPAAMVGGRTGKPWPGNYYWTYGRWVSKEHTSATCGNKAISHLDMPQLPT
jgi:hypothetical protein